MTSNGRPMNGAGRAVATQDESALERVLIVVTLTLFWAAFLSLAAGLALWLAVRTDPTGSALLSTGLKGLILLPVLRLILAMATALRTRDRILLAATVAVLVILCALTLRDAALP
jgi:hypothetical protein